MSLGMQCSKLSLTNVIIIPIVKRITSSHTLYAKKIAIYKNQQSVQCPLCKNWVHRKCNNITKAEFDILVDEDDDIPFHCILCNIKNNADIFPFGFLSKSELLDLHGIDMPSQLAMLPSFAVRSKLSKLPSLNDFDLDENLTYTINSKYYSLAEISKLNPVNESFSLFHLNIRSL